MKPSRPAPDTPPALPRAARGTARAALIEAAHRLVRAKGYAATSVDDLCAAAGVTKGAFFHHFASKEALGVAAAEAWTARANEHIFTLPDWTRLSDPVARVLAHVDFRAAMMAGPAEGFTCYVGTMVQESFATSEPLRRAADASITAYAGRLAEDVQAAIDICVLPEGVTASGIAWHVQAVLQGAFILAKARGDPSLARETVAHLKRYIEMLFAERKESCG